MKEVEVEEAPDLDARTDVDLDLAAIERGEIEPPARVRRWRGGSIAAAFRDLDHDVPSFDSEFWSDVAVVPHDCLVAERPNASRRAYRLTVRRLRRRRA